MKRIISQKYQLKYPYYATEEGLIWSEYSNKFLSFVKDKDGYMKVRLLTTSGRHAFSVHRLILETFLPNSQSGILQVNHIDGNKENNSIENLEWTTCQENIQHAIRLGLRANIVGDNNNAPHTLCEEQVKEIIPLLLEGKKTIPQIAKQFCVSISAIERIKYKKTWKFLTKDIDFSLPPND